MEGKAALFKEFAGINGFPICLKEQSVEKTIETIINISPVFGGINLEDFKAPECFEIEAALQDLGIPVMHDDQHGTAVVVLAGIINVFRIKPELNKEKVKVAINGCGAAGIAISKMLLNYGLKNILLVDSDGTINRNRTDLNKIKQETSKLTNPENSSGRLDTALRNADIFVGVSKANLLSSEMIKSMNQNPVIFALANPVPEIMPDIAKNAGAMIVAIGRSDFPNQINNVLAFPGIFKGALEINAKRITEKMKIAAAEALANYIVNPAPDKIIPGPLDKSVAKVVSEAVKNAYKNS